MSENGADLIGGDDPLKKIPQTIGDPDEGDEGNDDVDPLEALRAEMRAERERSEARDRQYQQQITQLLSRPVQVVAPQAPVEPEQAPDPVEKPAEYQRWQDQRVSKAVETAVGGVRSEVARENALNNVWNRFKSENPELAKREGLVQAIATVEVQKMRSEGLDPANVAINDPDTFIKRVKERVTAELGDTKPVAPKPRTGGLGAPSGGAGGGKKPKDDGKVMSFVEQLKKAQVDAGLI